MDNDDDALWEKLTASCNYSHVLPIFSVKDDDDEYEAKGTAARWTPGRGWIEA